MTPATRAVLTRVVNLELLLMPRLKGGDEKLVRELVWAAHEALKEDAITSALCRFPNVNPVYPDRTCPECHEDMNVYGGCRCNGYTMAGGPPKAPIR